MISEAGGYRIYTWHHTNLQRQDDDECQKQQGTERLWQSGSRGRLPQPDVLMSSFASWEEMGRWYGGLAGRAGETDNSTEGEGSRN